MNKLTTTLTILIFVFIIAFPAFAQDGDFRKEQEEIFHKAEQIEIWFKNIEREISESDLPPDFMEKIQKIPMVLGDARELAEMERLEEAWGIINRIEENMSNIERRIGSFINKKRIGAEGPNRDKKGVGIEFDWEIVAVALAIIGAVVGWVIARKKRRSVSKYLTEIDDVFNQYKMKSKRCEAELYRLRDMISEELKKGNIDENAYTVLDKRIDEYLVEVREGELNDKFGGMPKKLRSELNKMLEDGEITEKDYERFQGLIAKSSGIEEEAKEELDNLMKKWRNKDK